jgi:hypothetical protein
VTSAEDRLWAVAKAVTNDSRVTRSTMMGLPCLRWDGNFFACVDRLTGDLVVKLSKVRVDELIAAGQASPFAPAGRHLKQWAAVSVAQQHLWAERLIEAQKFASTKS